ncbi:cytidylate kinase-like family protein [Flammeovirga kamogawensis]|uniref:Cytidylate kinase-like family protein n=1 Tax=Flammeovirga kamogawensis TaxID=373891 RepID=A0ABX8H311_9BACT|nr:cytidylate kinase-like family protein [Flammeovirga kamogawensis]MBB6463575.1 cytidylate kinase [Flammeovirga kamogawensis]QWG09801.1 cytidylate kinase-like family protein [Flammeovirga kamogawensis]TRX65309.1 cytidylate kinase-like family protein [Flammeovirga kamogawensis]
MESFIYNYLIETELRHKKVPVANGMIVTMSREFGTNVRPAAQLLVDELNAKQVGFKMLKKSWKLVDSTILNNLSKELKVSAKELNNFIPVQNKSIIDQIMYSLDIGNNTLDEQLLNALKTVILSYLERGNVVFLGRGASFFTDGLQNALRVKVTASEKFRVTQFARKNDLRESYAREIVRRKNKRRKNFLKYVSQSVPINYDLTIERDDLSDHEIASSILSLVSEREIEMMRNV